MQLQNPYQKQPSLVAEIKTKLQGRRKNLQKISDSYFYHLNQYQVIRGTNKEDWFDIKRLPNGKTKVNAYRTKKDEKKIIFHERTYNKTETKEIWIYGLDASDTFVVKGSGTHLIKIRIIGGQNNDSYNILNGKQLSLIHI